MTKFESHVPRLLPPPRAHSLTIYRDKPLALTPAQKPLRNARIPIASDHDQAASGDRILLGLGLLTLPAVGYSLAQLWNLVSGGSLEQAVRAIVR